MKTSAPLLQAFLALLTCFLLAACQQQPEPLDIEKEKAAIKAVIAKETETYYRQDFEGWKSTYLESPDFRMRGYWEGFPEKISYHNGFESLKETKKKQFEQDQTLWKGSTEERDNECIRVVRDMAWYTFDQYSYEKGTRKLLGKSLETRILEKQNGEWKIAYLGYYYLPDTTAQK